jgi:hypothetical protein
MEGTWRKMRNKKEHAGNTMERQLMIIVPSFPPSFHLSDLSCVWKHRGNIVGNCRWGTNRWKRREVEGERREETSRVGRKAGVGE